LLNETLKDKSISEEVPLELVPQKPFAAISVVTALIIFFIPLTAAYLDWRDLQ